MSFVIGQIAVGVDHMVKGLRDFGARPHRPNRIELFCNSMDKVSVTVGFLLCLEAAVVAFVWIGPRISGEHGPTNRGSLRLSILFCERKKSTTFDSRFFARPQVWRFQMIGSAQAFVSNMEWNHSSRYAPVIQF
jgi:hypothetical protein